MQEKKEYWWAMHTLSNCTEPVVLIEGKDKFGLDYSIVWALGTEHCYKKTDFVFISIIPFPSDTSTGSMPIASKSSDKK